MGKAKKRKIIVQHLDRYIFLILLLLILVRPLMALYQHRANFFSPGHSKQYESLRKAYYSSQYMQKKNPGVIPDETFESFAGGAFLRGINPIMITHDHPPLGRYIISLSIFLFDNPSTILFFLLVISGLGIYLTSYLVLNNRILSLIPLGIFINEPLFMGKFSYTPLPEPIHLPFIILSIYCFIKGVQSKKSSYWFLATSLMLGFVISIRFFVLGLALASVMFAYLVINKHLNKLVIFCVMMPISLLVLIASYTKTILSGYSFVEILGIQKYILYYHKSKFISPFTFWDLFLFNRWHTWWGDMSILQEINWNFIWPISALLVFLLGVLYVLRKIELKISEKIIFLWVLVYCALLSSGYTSTRYFMPLLPYVYILAIAFLQKIISTRKINKNG